MREANSMRQHSGSSRPTPSCAESRPTGTQGISAACHCRPSAQVNHQPGAVAHGWRENPTSSTWYVVSKSNGRLGVNVSSDTPVWLSSPATAGVIFRLAAGLVEPTAVRSITGAASSISTAVGTWLSAPSSWITTGDSDFAVIAARLGASPDPEPLPAAEPAAPPAWSASFFPLHAAATSAIPATHVASRPVMFALYLPLNAHSRARIPPAAHHDTAPGRALGGCPRRPGGPSVRPPTARYTDLGGGAT